MAGFCHLYFWVFILCIGLSGIVWSFFVNKWHLKKLIKAGYTIDERQSEETILLAKLYIGMKIR